MENYLGLLDGYLYETLGLEQSKDGLVSSTHAVLLSNDPRRTNAETFYEAFASVLAAGQISRADFDPAVAYFYNAVYPQLQHITQKRPGARRLVEWLQARDYQVVVATNPFIPRVAIEQRLEWAGVPADEMGFDLVTTLEND